MIFQRGDIVKVNLNPIQGHEQGNYRPVVVMNDVLLPGNTNIVVPITTKINKYPLEVMLDDRTKTSGAILCFQIRNVDLNKRNAKFIEKIPDDLLEQCSDYIKRLVSKT